MKTTPLIIFTFFITFTCLSQINKQTDIKTDLILSEKQMLLDLDSLQIHINKAGIHTTLNKH